MSEPTLRLVVPDEDGVIEDDGSHVDASPRSSRHQSPEDRLREELAEVKVQLQGAERDIKAWRARYADAIADREEQARKDKLWPRAEKLFEEWKTLCRHPRSAFDRDRFEAVRPYLKREGYDKCLLAIQGAAFDPYEKARANGTMKRFDDFGLVFKSAEKFEEFCCRAPAEAIAAYAEKVRAQGELEEQADDA